MRDAEAIEQELRALADRHYYSEDYELEWAARHYVEALTPEEQDVFEQVMIRRLTATPDLTDVSIVMRVGRPAFTPYLAEMLNQEPHSNAMSRALLGALSYQPDESAYAAVERFMDSELEGEALTCLARMNFDRTLSHLRWALQKDHLHNYCLHALHEYKREHSVGQLAEQLKRLIEPEPRRLMRHVEKILRSSEGAFNPFTEEELETLLAITA